MSVSSFVHVGEKGRTVYSFDDKKKDLIEGRHETVDLDKDGKADIYCEGKECEALDHKFSTSGYGIQKKNPLTEDQKAAAQKEHEAGRVLANKRYDEFRAALKAGKVKMERRDIGYGIMKHVLFYIDSEGKEQKVELSKVDGKFNSPADSLGKNVTEFRLDNGGAQCVFDDPGYVKLIQTRLDELYIQQHNADAKEIKK
ncbi:MAG: hypothetical protein ABH871_08945 [Pseudomonadota bacterium]